MKNKNDVALVIAARVWCHKRAQGIVVDITLAEVFAEILRQVGDEAKMTGWVKKPPPEIELLNIEIVGHSGEVSP